MTSARTDITVILRNTVLLDSRVTLCIDRQVPSAINICSCLTEDAVPDGSYLLDSALPRRLAGRG
jgi:hypothetical protein